MHREESLQLQFQWQNIATVLFVSVLTLLKLLFSYYNGWYVVGIYVIIIEGWG